MLKPFDPSVTLKELRDLTGVVLQRREGRDYASLQLSLLFRPFDRWISNGGYLPRDWRGEGLNNKTFVADRTEFSRLLHDNERLYAQLGEVQDSNTKLVLENRALKAQLAEPAPETTVSDG